jgi:hypothetical protein
MVLAGVCPGSIGREHLRGDCELLGEKHYGGGGHAGKVVRHKAHEAEGTQLEGIAEAIVGGTVARNTLQVPLGQGKEGDQIRIRNDLGKAIPPGTFGLGKELDGHHHLRVDKNRRYAPRVSRRKDYSLLHGLCKLLTRPDVFFHIGGERCRRWPISESRKIPRM